MYLIITRLSIIIAFGFEVESCADTESETDRERIGQRSDQANRSMDTTKEEEKVDDEQQRQQQQQTVVTKIPKGKSCKGYLYYSSSLKSHHRNPRCIGIPRALPQGF